MVLVQRDVAKAKVRVRNRLDVALFLGELQALLEQLAVVRVVCVVLRQYSRHAQRRICHFERRRRARKCQGLPEEALCLSQVTLATRENPAAERGRSAQFW